MLFLAIFEAKILIEIECPEVQALIMFAVRKR